MTRTELIQRLKIIRKSICSYIGDTEKWYCDCKELTQEQIDSKEISRFHEHSGCVEIAIIIDIISAMSNEYFYKLINYDKNIDGYLDYTDNNPTTLGLINTAKNNITKEWNCDYEPTPEMIAAELFQMSINQSKDYKKLLRTIAYKILTIQGHNDLR